MDLFMYPYSTICIYYFMNTSLITKLSFIRNIYGIIFNIISWKKNKPKKDIILLSQFKEDEYIVIDKL